MTTVSSSGKISCFFQATKHGTPPGGKRSLQKEMKAGLSPVRQNNRVYLSSTLLTPDASPESDTNSGAEDDLVVKERQATVLEPSLKHEATGVEPTSEFVTVSGGCLMKSSEATILYLPDPPSQNEASVEIPKSLGAEQRTERWEVEEEKASGFIETEEVVSEGSAGKVYSRVTRIQPATPGDKKPSQGRKRGRGRGNRSATSRAQKSETEIKDSPGPAKSKKDKKKDDANANHKITEYFCVRRSDRKCLSQIQKETLEQYKQYVLSGHEDGLKKVDEVGDKGRGVIATKPFHPGDFLVEYAGELIDKKTAQERERAYNKDESVGCYMYYFIHNGRHYCVDATAETPRLGRLMNHSRKANNCRPKVVEIKNKPHLIFVAHRYIEAGEELLYDYGDTRKATMEIHPWLKS